MTRALVATVAARWKAEYLIGGTPSEDRLAILKRLEALPSTALPEDVAAVIGNSSWTELRCHECGLRVERVVQVGEEPDYESSTASLCVPCLGLARALADGSDA